MAFIVKNTAFECLWCGEKNPPAEQTCRNHCKKCLCSLHLDENFPGDRESKCMGKMKPIRIEPHAKHEWVIIHECKQCKKTISNKKADDDDLESILSIMKKNAEKNI